MHGGLEIDMARPPTKPLYFLHIPKTAGTSLTSYLDRQFEPEQIFPFQLWPDYLEGLEREPIGFAAKSDHYTFYRGHFGFGLVEEVARPISVVTFLREPRALLRSLFNHLLTDTLQGHDVHPGLDGSIVDLGAFLASVEGRAALTDVQSRYVLSSLTSGTITDRHRTGGSFFALTDVTVDAGRADDLFGSLDFVGIQNLYPESVLLLSHTLGLAPPVADELYARQMVLADVAPRPSSGSSARLGEMVDAITGNDRRLYDRYRARLIESYDQLVEMTTGSTSWTLADASIEERAAMVAELLAKHDRWSTVARADPDPGPGPDFRAVTPMVEVTGSIGETAEIRVTVENTGVGAAFGHTRFRPANGPCLLVATAEPVNRISALEHPSWFSPSRPSGDFSLAKAGGGRPDALEPGDRAHFTFTITLPERRGSYEETFTVVLEGQQEFSGSCPIRVRLEVT